MTEFQNELGDLGNPLKNNHLIELGDYETATLLEFVRSIYLIRRCEEILGELAKSKEVKTPIHLGIGQEAIAVGVGSSLSNTDRIFSNHRSHAHFLSLGASPYKLFAEVLGKQTGASKGMGGSMHLVDRDVGFWGSVPIVGGTIPVAVGAALAAKKDASGRVAIAYFGDGACEEGVLHESLNLASVMNLPIIFVCENNLYSSHMDMFLRQPSNRVSRFADAHKVPSLVVDGNDVVAVGSAAQTAISAARNGKGPYFLEAITFRWRGHVGPEADIDVGISRSAEELRAWMTRDPLQRLERSLIENRACATEHFSSMKMEVDNLLSQHLDLARGSAPSNLENLLGFVYG